MQKIMQQNNKYDSKLVNQIKYQNVKEAKILNDLNSDNQSPFKKEKQE
jgi:hypothetical protein